MTYSMTAFARGERPIQSGVLSCEIKTVNHRYLDVSVRATGALRELEAEATAKIRNKLARGRVECLLNVQTDGGKQTTVDVKALAALAEEMRTVATALGEADLSLSPASIIEMMKWPGVSVAAELDVERLRKDAAELLDETLDKVAESRREEGRRLETFVLGHCTDLERVIAQLRRRYPQALAAARDKLNDRLNEIDVDVEPERLAQEAAILAQKLYLGADIEEELNRCTSHVEELKAIFKREEPIGRRLDFMAQELNRETNTISSKSIDVETTHTAVEAKTLVEQIREQVQNIE